MALGSLSQAEVEMEQRETVVRFNGPFAAHTEATANKLARLETLVRKLAKSDDSLVLAELPEINGTIAAMRRDLYTVENHWHECKSALGH
jgi:hypothetical protein